MTKRIVLCADDYGQAPAITQAIIALIQNQRLSATSCLVNTMHWPEHARQLVGFKDKVDIGLHFNLTEGKALSSVYIEKYQEKFYSLGRLLALTYLRKIDRSVIEGELEAQLDAFVQAMGFLPDFIDGHQHVHQFPIIRQALINVYQKRLQEKKAYIRLVKQRTVFLDVVYNLKKIIIQSTGTTALQRLLEKNQIPFNQSFAGIYSFDQAKHYQRIFPTFLHEIKDQGVIMCHPGLFSLLAGDKIAKARYAEYNYLNSDQFLTDCRNNQVELSRFSFSSP